MTRPRQLIRKAACWVQVKTLWLASQVGGRIALYRQRQNDRTQG